VKKLFALKKIKKEEEEGRKEIQKSKQSGRLQKIPTKVAQFRAPYS
jgi:hypothetical protein